MNKNDIKTVDENNPKIAIKLKDIMGTGGSLSASVYFHALMIAKKSILEKPFGWGVNRYDKAFEFFNKKDSLMIEKLKNYNNKDGTNNFVKLIVELGVFALIIYLFFLSFKSIASIAVSHLLYILSDLMLLLPLASTFKHLFISGISFSNVFTNRLA